MDKTAAWDNSCTDSSTTPIVYNNIRNMNNSNENTIVNEQCKMQGTTVLHTTLALYRKRQDGFGKKVFLKTS